RGVQDGAVQEEARIVASLGRALSAATEWDAVLACARDPNIDLVFSNTTETGIRLDTDDVPGPAAPRSFPGKLTRFLFERAQAFDYARERGVVVLPCELIEDNGEQLKQIVLQLAAQWSLGSRFTDWLEQAVPFCNTLVDRIVPGQPAPAERARMWQELGYRDELLTSCEIYRLYAIQADAQTAARLTFTAADPGIIVAADIAPYRERKVRLLNGTHTIMVPCALLAGCETVADAVGDEQLGGFIRRALFDELVPSTDVAAAEPFAHDVLDRFANPYIRHALTDITLQQTAKMRLRVVPAIRDYGARFQRAPVSLAFGFAGYLLYVRDHGPRPDDEAVLVRAAWQAEGPEAIARAACRNTIVWGCDLAEISGFAEQVAKYLEIMMRAGVRAALDVHLAVPQQV
ncbi:MAG TPA: tagaturonate reductase, partial [Longimicrobiales bacterium]